jgi:hypothetical protein
MCINIQQVNWFNLFFSFSAIANHIRFLDSSRPITMAISASHDADLAVGSYLSLHPVFSVHMSAGIHKRTKNLEATAKF